MKTWKILTLVMALVSVAAPLVARFTAWLSRAGKGWAFAVALPLAVAVALVLYFHWRSKLKRRILAQDDRHELVSAA